jgi:D-alanyl-lipoteichoic acid acyltransferase DltB (MBOAT superfamily)
VVVPGADGGLHADLVHRWAAAFEHERFRDRRRLVLGLGIFGVLALLGYFKYAQFVGGYALDFIHVITRQQFPGLHAFVNGIVLPIGISFYTFEGISYLVDVYRGTLRAERDPLRYAFFISFFPHLIAGPIVRYGILQPQLLEKSRSTRTECAPGSCFSRSASRRRCCWPTGSHGTSTTTSRRLPSSGS